MVKDAARPFIVSAPTAGAAQQRQVQVVIEELAGRAVDTGASSVSPTTPRCWSFGSDKPDLRNPLRIRDVTQQFAGSGFGLFARIAASGGVVRAHPAPGAASQPRSFFDKLNEWARAQGAGGLGCYRL